MEKEQTDLLKKVDRKLGALIALQMIEDKPDTTRSKIELMSRLGFGPGEIATILNVKPKYVSKEKSLLGKKNGRKTI